MTEGLHGSYLTLKPKMEKFWSPTTEEILNLTLEIIYLLTGENYGPIKKEESEHSIGEWSQNSTMEPPPTFLTPETLSNAKKIVEVTQKIIRMLTGEVPIRCQDVSVYFSMEEWEYLEGHEDLYEDVMMEDQPPLTSPALLSRASVSRLSPPSNRLNEENDLPLRPVTAECSPKQWKTETSCKEEESVPYSDISTLTDIHDLSLPIMEEHLLCEERSPVFSPPAHHTPSPSKEEALAGPRLTRPTPPLAPVNHRRFVCGKCGRTFSIISNLEMHMKTHSGAELYKCWECGETFSEALLLADHYPLHTAEKKRAGAAGEQAEERSASSARGKQSQRKEQTFACDKCGGRFSSKYNLNVHTKRHSGVKPYSCAECGKGFTTKYGLNKHCKNYATDKPSSCLEVGTQQTDLSKRMMGHSSRKDYRCSGCQMFGLRETSLLKPRLIYPKLPSEEEAGPVSREKDSRHVT